MLFDTARADVAEKVRKLLTQAEDRAATPEEAQAFTFKAQQLMTKYAIDLAMITDASKAAQMVGQDWMINGPYASHKVTLVNAVARTNDCRVVYTGLSGGRRRVDVVGYAEDVAWVETLFRSLETQLMIALAAAMRSRARGVHGRTYAVGFVEGFVSEISGRLHQARQQVVATAPVTSEGSSVALVLVAKAKRVDDEFRVRHPNTRAVHTQTRLASWSGYEPGRAAGRQARIARGSVGGSRRGLSA
jgi:hypothetical protein